MAEVEDSETKNKKIEQESSVVAMLIIVFLLSFARVIMLLANGNCSDYFSREYSISGFMTQIGPYLFVAVGTAGFYFAAVRILRLVRMENSKEHASVILGISFMLFVYAMALVQLAQGNCVYHYSKETTLFSLTRDYFPGFLFAVGTCYLYLTIKRIIKLIAQKTISSR